MLIILPVNSPISANWAADLTYALHHAGAHVTVLDFAPKPIENIRLSQTIAQLSVKHEFFPVALDYASVSKTAVAARTAELDRLLKPHVKALAGEWPNFLTASRSGWPDIVPQFPTVALMLLKLTGADISQRPDDWTADQRRRIVSCIMAFREVFTPDTSASTAFSDALRAFVLAQERAVSIRLQTDQLRDKLRSLNASAVIQMYESAIQDFMFSKSVRETGTPIFFMPDAYGTASQVAAHFRDREQLRVAGDYQSLAIRFAPEIVYKDSAGPTLTRFAWHPVAPAFMAGVIESDTWRPCSSPSSGILCKNDLVRQSMLSDGFAQDRLLLVGSPGFDRALLRSRVLKGDYATPDGGRPKAVISVAADIWGSSYQATRFMRNFDEYVAVLSKVADVLGGRFDVCLCLHPRLLGVEEKLAKLKPVAEISKLTIFDEVLDADVFVSYVGSVLNPDLLSFGKPVLALSLYDNANNLPQNRIAADGYRPIESDEALETELGRAITETLARTGGFAIRHWPTTGERVLSAI